MKRILSTALSLILVLQAVSMVYAWEIERPAYDIDIKERTENACTNGEASVGIGVAIDDYDEGAAQYGGDDCVTLNISMTANSRMGIAYDWNWYTDYNFWWIPESELYYRNDMIGVGDDVIVPVDIPQPWDVGYFAFRFYGGRWSAEYQRIYVSTNGFISFDNRSQPIPTPSDIPSTARPNALVAAVWSDLNVDSSSSIITGFWVICSRWHYVIMWNNVLHKASGKRLTFEIILENAPQFIPVNEAFSQSRVWISYKWVSSINTDFAFGIEDQQGAKGLGALCSGSSLSSFNRYTIEFYQSSNSYFLKRLTLTFQDTNSKTQFETWEGPNYTRGYNIRWNINQPSQPDSTYMFGKALAGWAALLIGAWGLVGTPPGWVMAGGFIVDTVLVGWDTVELLAYKQYSGMLIEVSDINDGLWQTASATALTYDYVVDASLSLVVDWILRTPNNVGAHSLTITATLEYYGYSIITGEIITKNPISTSVNLKIGPDNNDSPETAQPISTGWTYRLYIGGYDADDYYKIYVNTGYRLYVYVQRPSEPKPDLDLYIYNPGRSQKAYVTIPPNTYVEITADLSGYWFIKLHLREDYGFYNLYVSVYYPSSGGGGCPILYVWNGSKYTCEGLLDIHNPDGVDVITNHTLVTTPAWMNGAYRLRLVEHPQTISHIDQVKLYAILADGKAVKLPLIWAWHSEYGNVLPQLLLSDDWKVDELGADWNDGVSQSIDLKFAAPPNIKAVAFIFQIEGNNIIAKI